MLKNTTVGMCIFYNSDTGYCGNPKRRFADLRYAFGKLLPGSEIICDYDKDHDKMSYCDHSEYSSDKGGG